MFRREMKRLCLLIAFLMFLIPQLLAQNPDLKALAEEDQAARNDENKQPITRTDDDRIKLVLELLAKGLAQTPADKFNAALVLQHTPLIFSEGRMASESPYNYL